MQTSHYLSIDVSAQYIHFDDYYLPDKKEIHNNHVNLIYGYDTDDRYYLSIGYNNKEKFRKIIIPFEAAEKGYEIPIVEVFRPDYTKTYKFNRDNFLIQIHDFLNSENNLISSEELIKIKINKKDYFYGISVYDRILEHMEQQKQDTHYDKRNLYQLWEHTVLNWERVKFLYDNGMICNKEELNSLLLKMQEYIKFAKSFMYKYILDRDLTQLNTALDLVKQHRESNYLFYSLLTREI